MQKPLKVSDNEKLEIMILSECSPLKYFQFKLAKSQHQPFRRTGTKVET